MFYNNDTYNPQKKSWNIQTTLRANHFPKSAIQCWETQICSACLQNVTKLTDGGGEGIKKGELGLFLTPVLMLWSGSHIDRHVWRWVIVPSDLARSLGAICEHYHYRVIHRAITYRGSARFHRLTPNKKFEPMSSTGIMAVCSLFSKLLLSIDLIIVHLLLCRTHCDDRLYPHFSWTD